jgi:transcriptional regulator of heat shock response
MDRRTQVLKAIVQHFITTAEPVGSNTIIVSYKFEVSPATIRNEMVSLEEEGLIFQPHTSSGRVPTELGYRRYVEEIADYDAAEKRAKKMLNSIWTEYVTQKAKEKIYDAVNVLARATGSVSFATIPGSKHTFFLGLSNVLKQPEFQDPVRASQVIEILENDDNFLNTLASLTVEEEPQIFIGQENILPQIQSCSIIVARYAVSDFEGLLGVLGPIRMDYAFNVALLKEIKKLLM